MAASSEDGEAAMRSIEVAVVVPVGDHRPPLGVRYRSQLPHRTPVATAPRAGERKAHGEDARSDRSDGAHRRFTRSQSTPT